MAFSTSREAVVAGECIHDELRDAVRQASGKKELQLLRLSTRRVLKRLTGMRGFDAKRKLVERRRHVVVDTAGLILGVLITAANVSDQAGARELLKEVCLRFGCLRHIWADAGYLGPRSFSLLCNTSLLIAACESRL